LLTDNATKILVTVNGIATAKTSLSMGLIIFDCDGVLVDGFAFDDDCIALPSVAHG
jgi:hypothetical protein